MPTVRCEKCGKWLSICVIPYQRMHFDKTTGDWVLVEDLCKCDKNDPGVFGLLKKMEAHSAKRKEREKQEKNA